jgi:hypothetical protein
VERNGYPLKELPSDYVIRDAVYDFTPSSYTSTVAALVPYSTRERWVLMRNFDVLRMHKPEQK